MREAAALIGQVGRDPLGAEISIEFREQVHADVSEVVMRLSHTGFAHRHLGAQRVGGLPEQTGQGRRHRRQHADGDGGAGQLQTRRRTRVRTERAPSGRALVRCRDRGPPPGASSPARVSRLNR